VARSREIAVPHREEGRRGQQELIVILYVGHEREIRDHRQREDGVHAQGRRREAGALEAREREPEVLRDHDVAPKVKWSPG
jgi:hypothetical protein